MDKYSKLAYKPIMPESRHDGVAWAIMVPEQSFQDRALALWAIVKSPWCWPIDFAVAYTIAHFFPAIFSTPKARADAMSQWLSDLNALAQSPIFQICFLVTAFACMWNGVRKVSAAAKCGDAASTDSLRRARNLLEPLRELAKIAMERKTLEAIQMHLAAYEERVEDYKRDYAAHSGRDGVALGSGQDRLSNRLQNVENYYQIIVNKVKDARLSSFQKPAMANVSGSTGDRSVHFDPNANQAYLKAHADNLTELHLVGLSFNGYIRSESERLSQEEEKFLRMIADG